jgi:hypothetical protein
VGKKAIKIGYSRREMVIICYQFRNEFDGLFPLSWGACGLCFPAAWHGGTLACGCPLLVAPGRGISGKGQGVNGSHAPSWCRPFDKRSPGKSRSGAAFIDLDQ